MRTTTAADIEAQISKSQDRIKVLEAELAAAEKRLAEVETAHRLAVSAQQRLAEVSGADAPAGVPDDSVREAKADIERIQAEIRQERAVLEKLKERQHEQAVARAKEAVRAMEPIFDQRDTVAAEVLKAVEALVALGDELEEADQQCIVAHRTATQQCSAAGLEKPEYRRFYFGRLHATRERFQGRRVTVEVINSLNRGA